MNCKRQTNAAYNIYQAMNKHHDNLLKDDNDCVDGSFFICTNPVCIKAMLDNPYGFWQNKAEEINDTNN